MFWTLTCAGSGLLEVISTTGLSKNGRRQKRRGRRRERGIWVGWEFNTPKSTQSAVTWFRALYIIGLVVHNMVQLQWIGYRRLGSTITNMCTQWWIDQYIYIFRWGEEGNGITRERWKHVKMSSSRCYELFKCSIWKRLSRLCRGWWVVEDGTEKHGWTWTVSWSTWFVTLSSNSNSTSTVLVLISAPVLKAAVVCVKEPYPSDGKGWIVRQCEIGRSWYVCFSFADTTTFYWTLLDAQPGSFTKCWVVRI